MGKKLSSNKYNVMKAKYQKPMTVVVEIKACTTLLQTSTTLNVNWTDDETDAADAD